MQIHVTPEVWEPANVERSQWLLAKYAHDNFFQRILVFSLKEGKGLDVTGKVKVVNVKNFTHEN